MYPVQELWSRPLGVTVECTYSIFPGARKCTHLKWIIQWFWVNLQSYASITTFRKFPSPQKGLWCSHSPFALSIPTLSPRIKLSLMYSVYIDLPYLDTSCKWNHIIWSLLCLGSLTEDNVSGILPCCSMYPLFLFIAQCYSAVWIKHIYFSCHQLMNIWIVPLFWLLWIMLLRTFVLQVFVWIYSFVFLGQIPDCWVIW